MQIIKPARRRRFISPYEEQRQFVLVEVIRATQIELVDQPECTIKYFVEPISALPMRSTVTPLKGRWHAIRS
ncbi:hypothetical protein C8J35_1093 [Rhizobium sp. PP-F2F-G38]|uniref:hypothetical protein n=1 Tax=Rhizobium sp. PP-CC-3G-465 TaxID=2135648 RepID=UPI000D9E74F7|nr:hypothetical protein C8J37_11391 [Rhizobium sp. PP-WC-1G-195]PYE94737.1 hypothetical protein C8J35_1093 [Rhizobium sp. PP-F2F-G38]TCP81577.1 hypothetical protein C8J31_11223 [Rhizobium sp. PP-CC-2G-626]TCQ05442.1 hypothetical protein C8J34_107173 [Rhizobium sp. PP-F2F-G36]TCQ26081.1 hypothetical protein C8J33_102355 [Rhizobium sp. PP-CC-3G-465]